MVKWMCASCQYRGNGGFQMRERWVRNKKVKLMVTNLRRRYCLPCADTVDPNPTRELAAQEPTKADSHWARTVDRYTGQGVNGYFGHLSKAVS